ncbi:hypothetical protein DFH09DRAFT_1500220 [Mycena vulgaris]|nr:hypothetical protein DFH09DRAFT_1500220 [Mycena vulgaris]
MLISCGVDLWLRPWLSVEAVEGLISMALTAASCVVRRTNGSSSSESTSRTNRAHRETGLDIGRHPIHVTSQVRLVLEGGYAVADSQHGHGQRDSEKFLPEDRNRRGANDYDPVFRGELHIVVGGRCVAVAADPDPVRRAHVQSTRVRGWRAQRVDDVPPSFKELVTEESAKSKEHGGQLGRGPAGRVENGMEWRCYRERKLGITVRGTERNFKDLAGKHQSAIVQTPVTSFQSESPDWRRLLVDPAEQAWVRERSCGTVKSAPELIRESGKLGSGLEA